MSTELDSIKILKNKKIMIRVIKRESSERRKKLGYSKKDLILHIAKSKKVIRLLKKLQKLCWSTIEVGTWEFIEREENDLATYERKLKNKEYINQPTKKNKK